MDQNIDFIKNKVQTMNNNMVNSYKGFNNSSQTKKFLIIIIIVIIIVLIVLSIYFYKRYVHQLKKLINCKNCSRFYKHGKPGISSKSIDGSKINKSIDGISSTWCFWIKIDNWYYRYNQWKNICVKGSTTNTETELEWNTLRSQCPGIWLDPNLNNLRVVFSTQIVSKQGTIEDHLEYCQINDVPIGQWAHISVVLINKSVAIYLNGRLVRTCVFKGKAQFNDGPLQVNYSGGFNGEIRNFRYINSNLPPKYIYELYLKGYDERKSGWGIFDDLNIPKISFNCPNN
jgi:hypothetical protein